MKIVMKAKDIPFCESITKKTGEKVYLLVPEIRIYGLDIEPIKRAGYVFLVDGGNINVFDENKELIWLTDIETLVAYYGRRLCDECCSYS